jgi:universal stress protein A
MYNTILVAVDLSKDSLRVLDKATAAANGDNSNIHLVHVVEPVAAAYSMDIYAVNINELQQEAIAISEKKLKEIAKRLNIDESKVHTLLGAPGPEVRNLAVEINADAIVIGSHGHSGWKILLGSTAIKVLHGATCDVLTVYVGEN